MAPTTTLLGAVTPWLRILKKATAIYDTPDHAHETAFVHVETFDSGYNDADDPLPDYKALEGLQLLVLLGELDFEAWQKAVAIAWPGDAERLTELCAGRALRLGARLGFNHHIQDAEICPVDEWSERLVKNQSGRAGSSGYERVRQRLEDAYKAAEEDIAREIRPRAQLEIPVRLVFFIGPYLVKLHKMIEMIENQDFDDTHQGWKPLLRIEEADPGGKGEEEEEEEGDMTMQEFHALAHLARCGLTVDSMDWGGVNIPDKHAVIYAKGLQTLMKTKAKLPGEPKRRVFVKRIHIGRNLNRRTLSALFSAVLTSQSVKVLSYNQNTSMHKRTPVSPADRSSAWQWVIYSLFSQSATHDLSEVRLFVDDLSMDDIAAITMMVEHRDPLAVLLGADQVETSEVIEYITASKFLLSTEGTPRHLKLAPQEGRVLRRTNDLVSVLLPGAGVVWVHQLDCIERRTTSATGFGARGIQRVEFVRVNDQSKHAVLALLRLFGHGIAKLGFPAMKCKEPLDDWYDEVGKLCPSWSLTANTD